MLEGFRGAVEQRFEATMVLRRALLSAIAGTLNVPQDYFTPMFARSVDCSAVKYDNTFA